MTMLLTRGILASDSEATLMLKFRFELNGAVYGRKFYESTEVTHAFDCVNRENITRLMMPTTSLMAKLNNSDHLIIRWYFAMLSPVPATTIVPTTVASIEEGWVLTPWLSFMYSRHHYY